jgi:hypothetical protein
VVSFGTGGRSYFLARTVCRECPRVSINRGHVSTGCGHSELDERRARVAPA